MGSRPEIKGANSDDIITKKRWSLCFPSLSKINQNVNIKLQNPHRIMRLRDFADYDDKQRMQCVDFYIFDEFISHYHWNLADAFGSRIVFIWQCTFCSFPSTITFLYKEVPGVFVGCRLHPSYDPVPRRVVDHTAVQQNITNLKVRRKLKKRPTNIVILLHVHYFASVYCTARARLSSLSSHRGIIKWIQFIGTKGYLTTG